MENFVNLIPFRGLKLKFKENSSVLVLSDIS